jgi:tight adherence protein B
MSGPGLALLLLAATLTAAVAAVALLASAASQRAALVSRAAADQPVRRGAGLLRRLDSLLRATAAGADVEQRLLAAGSELRVVDLVVMALASAAAVFVLARTVMGSLLALAAALAAAWAWRVWLERRRAKRREAFVAQLPDLARVLSNGASAGLSMVGAVDMAAAELDEPARSEMRLALAEIRVGQPIEDALERMARRMPSRELSVLVNTLVIQQRSGGDVVRALREMGETLEARKDLRREVKTVMAGAVFTAYLVSFMGIGTLVLLNTISPGVLRQMSNSPAGRIALLVAGAMYLAGFFSIRRITRVEQ